MFEGKEGKTMLMKLIFAAIVVFVVMFLFFKEKLQPILDKTSIDEGIVEGISGISEARRISKIQSACLLIEGELSEEDLDEWKEIKAKVAVKVFS